MCVILSWTTILVHSRDYQEVDVVHKVKSPVSQPQFSQTTIGQYWLGKTKPKQTSDRPEMLSKSCHGIQKKKYLTEFSPHKIKVDKCPSIKDIYGQGYVCCSITLSSEQHVKYNHAFFLKMSCQSDKRSDLGKPTFWAHWMVWYNHSYLLGKTAFGMKFHSKKV